MRGVRTAVGRQRRSEIFVDVLERLTVVLSADGSVVNASLDGSIQMKSYLDGKYILKLALNEDVVFVNQVTGNNRSSPHHRHIAGLVRDPAFLAVSCDLSAVRQHQYVLE